MTDSLPNALREEEWTYLQQHMRVTTLRSAEPHYSIDVSELLREDACAAYLDRITEVL